MKIYIPKYLVSRVPILGRLSKLILGYSEEFGNQGNDDYYDYYRYHGRVDDVTRFLDYVIQKKGDPRIRNNQITYLRCILFSVKGTEKLLRYLNEYGLFEVSSISYDTKTLTVEIERLSDFLEYGKFCEYLEKFFSALLWFRELNIRIRESNSSIKGSTVTCLTSNVYVYSKIREQADKTD